MKVGLIYKVTNTINNKVYIGQTIQDVNKRWYDHVSQAKSCKKPGYFQRAILKYGRNAFSVTILEKDIPKEKLDEQEVYYIKKFDSYSKGYNSTIGGQKLSTSKAFYVPTAEHRANMSKAKKGKPLNWSKESLEAVRQAKLGAKHPNYGKSHIRVSCIYCKKNVTPNVLGYYHGNKCKSHPDNVRVTANSNSCTRG